VACAAGLLIVAESQVPAQPAVAPDSVRAASAPPSPVVSPRVEVTKALAWPIAALLLAALLRGPLGRFLETVGPRITKLGAFQVQLELAASTHAASGPALAEIRALVSVAPVGDSSAALFSAVQDTTPADHAVIVLGEGDEWLTSRLFIAAAMLERMRGVRCLVFVEKREGVGRRFVALAPPSLVRWQLALTYPWLEIAYTAAVLQLSGQYDQAHPFDAEMISRHTRHVVSAQGALDPYPAQQLVQNFVRSLQKGTKPSDPSSWVEIRAGWERAAWVTTQMLDEVLLPDDASDQWVREERIGDAASLTKAVLHRTGAFTAVVDEQHRFRRLINRDAVLEEVARRYQV
jgi:hypothetical protein